MGLRRKANQGSRKTEEHLSYEEIPTRCSGLQLMCAPGKWRRIYWVRPVDRLDSRDVAHAVSSWEVGVQMLSADFVTVAIDSGGSAHIRYASPEARDYARSVIRSLQRQSNDAIRIDEEE